MTRSTMFRVALRARAVPAVSFPLVVLLAGGAVAAQKPTKPKGGDPLAEPAFIWEPGRDPFEFRPKGGTLPLLPPGNKEEALRFARKMLLQAEQHLARKDKTKAADAAGRALDRLRRAKAAAVDPGLVAKLNGVLKSAEVEPQAGDSGRYVEEADAYLRGREFAMAAQVANDGLSRIESSGVRIAVEDREMLVRMRDTALRLDKLAKIEEEFRNLTIVLDGIVWRPGGGAALIGGKVYRTGEEIEGAKGARLEEIREGALVFLFKGVRVRKSLTE